MSENARIVEQFRGVPTVTEWIYRVGNSHNIQISLYLRVIFMGGV